MSEFQGASQKVRCTDCSQFSGSQCSAKNTKVSPKKRRICDLYQFKGKYENRTPLESTYIPKVDKKTRRLLNKLLKLGVVSPASPDTLSPGVSPFRSTATAGIVKMGDPDRKGESAPKPEGGAGQESFTWTPEANDD